MRRSGSQLRSLSNHAGRRGYGNPPAGNNAGTMQYADEIQRRIDALGIGGQHPSAPNMHQTGMYGEQLYAHAPHPMQNPMPMHNPAMPFANVPQAQIHQPMYADFPAPNYGAPQSHDTGGEINQMRDAIDALSGQLHAMQQQQNQTAQTLVQTQSIGSEQHAHMGAITNELSELKRIIASGQTSVQEISNLNQTLEVIKAEIAGSAANSAPAVDTEAYARVVETSHSDLTRQIEQMRAELNKASPAELDTNIIHKTLEASHDELKAQIEQLQNSINSGAGDSKLDKEEFEQSHKEVLNQLSDIQTLLLESASSSKDADDKSTDFENIEMRLEEITRAVVALSHSDPATDGIERIEARIGELSKKLGETSLDLPASDGDTTPLIERLDLIADRLDGMSGSLSADGPNDANNAILYEISQKLDALDARVSATGNAENTSALLADPELLQNLKQLSLTTQELNAGSQNVAIQKLEANVEHIIHLLSSDHSQTSDNLDLTKKLASIEEQIASSRDISIEMATKVAQETVERVMDQIQSVAGNPAAPAPELSVLSGLSEDIHKLQEASTQTNAQNLDAFTAIKDTLGSMVDRLSMLEEGVSTSVSQPNVAIPSAPAAMQAIAQPPVETQPLEEENTVPSIPNMEEFDEPVRLGGYETAEKATGQDMVAEYRALVSEQQSEENSQEESQVSVAQSLVEEAARAEEERQKLRASLSGNANGQINDSDDSESLNDREFHSSEMAIETFEDEDFVPLPEAEAPEISTPMASVEEVSEEVLMDIDDRPLEPGSAGPDLAALVRKANETRKNRSKNAEGTSGTEFIAAARRAAQAAAEEASAAAEEIEKQEKQSDKGVLSAIPSLFSKRKKVISMAAVATLLAAMSIPMIIGAFGTNETDQVASADSQEIYTEATPDLAQSEAVQATPRVIEAVPAPASDEEVVVASLGEVQPESPLDAQKAPAFDSSELLTDLTYVNDALKTAVAEGKAEALYEVGRRHLEGIGVEKSPETALEWYKRAAELEFAPAQYLVANLHEKGIGVERDLAEAIKWYEKAADNGNVISMHNLAVLHATPNGVNAEPDTAEAYKWFKKAAGYGVKDSLVNLGIFYTKGVGTDVDLVEAYKWFTLAAKAGDDDAANKREVVTEYMRPDQLELAKSQIEDWRPAEQQVSANIYQPDAQWTADLVAPVRADDPKVIRKAQALLGRLGYDAGPADGIMGTKTKQAIAEFQQRVGLGVDGNITAEFLAELEAVAI